MTNSRSKGKRGELHAARVMHDITGERWRRTQQHSSGGIVGDIEPIDPASPWRRLHVEVKNVEVMELGNKAWQNACVQAACDCPGGRRPVVLWKMRRGVWAVTLWNEDAKAWHTCPAEHAARSLRLYAGLGDRGAA